jgi:hypothetical protein
MSGIHDREIAWPRQASAAAATIKPVAGPSDISKMPAVLDDLKKLAELRQQIETATDGQPRLPGFSARPRLDDTLQHAQQALLHNALAPHLDAVLESQLVDMNADTATLESLIRLADRSAPGDEAALRGWLEKSAKALPQVLRATFVGEGLAAVKAAGGMTVGAPYIDAARRIIAYKESLS